MLNRETKMNNFKDGELEIAVKEENSGFYLTWLGKSVNRNPSDTLDPYFAGMIDQLKGKKVSIDFTKFEYMNSSTVSPIINFMKLLEENKIETVIYYNKDLKWQVVSFRALETIVTKYNSVLVKAA
jgi:hypothetical protein